MAQIPILNGIYVSPSARLRTSYPRNLVPTPKDDGISKGYLRQPEGLVRFDQGGAPGIDRGGINWNGVQYRVMGSSLVTVAYNGTIVVVGDVGNDANNVSFTYSFDRLAVVSAGKMYYLVSGSLTQVTDINLGVSLDAIWVDGYFMSTDGTYVIVTSLSNPFVVNPLKYGSAETDPDNIVCLMKLRNQPHLVGRYTIEVLQDVGGALFPFQRIDGATMSRGTIGRKACCVFPVGQIDQLVFLGSGKNEPCAVWIGTNGVTIKISTAEIDKIIKGYSDIDLAKTVVEVRLDESHAFVHVHLPDRTLVYDYNASQALGQSVWFTLDSGLATPSQFRARGFVWCYNQWTFGDPTTAQLGTFSDGISTHYGNECGWAFDTIIVYNGGNSGLVHELELVALTGNVALNDNPTISTSYTSDGITYSNEKFISAGKIGDRDKRLVWLQQGPIRKTRMQRFKGTSKAHIALLILEARIEALANGF